MLLLLGAACGSQAGGAPPEPRPTLAHPYPRSGHQPQALLAAAIGMGRSSTPPVLSGFVWSALLTACLRCCLADGGDGAAGGAAAAGLVPMEGGGEAAHRGLNAAAPTGGEAEERAASVAEELLMEAFRQRQVRGLREWWPSFLAVQAECACVHPTVEAILHEALYVDW